MLKNIDGNFYNQTDDIRKILENHMVSPVRFDKAITKMQENGVDTYIEVGPGKALSGFVKKQNKEANVINICDIPTLTKALEMFK